MATPNPFKDLVSGLLFPKKKTDAKTSPTGVPKFSSISTQPIGGASPILPSIKKTPITPATPLPSVQESTITGLQADLQRQRLVAGRGAQPPAPDVTQGDALKTVTPQPTVARTPSGLTLEEATVLQNQQTPNEPVVSGSTIPATAEVAEPTIPTVSPVVKKQVADAEKAVADAMRVSPEFTQTEAELDRLSQSLTLGINKIKDQPIPMPFITGQSASVLRQALARAQPLEQKLSRLQSKRVAALSASQFALDRVDTQASAIKEDREKAEELAADKRADIFEIASVLLEKGADRNLIKQIMESKDRNEALEFAAESGLLSEEELQGEGFTLSPGQIRFDDEGNVLATGGAKPPTAAQEKRAAEKEDAIVAAQTAQTETIGLVNTILANPDLNTVIGASRLGVSARLAGTAGVRSQLTQLKALTSLEGRSALKGSGTISDFEAKMLSDSANALNFAIQEDGRVAMSDDDVQQNLQNIRGVLLSKVGQPVTVIATDPSTGESELFENVTREDIADASLKGLVISYQ